MHVVDLAGVPRHLTVGDGGDALDGRAIAAYKQRLAELAEEQDDADAAHDLARAERARTEYDTLVDQLARAVGLGGRRRTAGPEPIERLRKAVSARLHDAIRRIEEVHPGSVGTSATPSTPASTAPTVPRPRRSGAARADWARRLTGTPLARPSGRARGRRTR